MLWSLGIDTRLCSALLRTFWLQCSRRDGIVVETHVREVTWEGKKLERSGVQACCLFVMYSQGNKLGLTEICINPLLWLTPPVT